MDIRDGAGSYSMCGNLREDNEWRYVYTQFIPQGDTVEIRDKKVYINGKRLIEPYAVHLDRWNMGFPRDEYGPVKVPPGSLFVLGDNRDSSEDSRYWGYVPQKNIIGEVFLIYWPPWRVKIIRPPLMEFAKKSEILSLNI